MENTVCRETLVLKYRQQANKNMAIPILADLYLMKPGEVANILFAAGEHVPTQFLSPKKRAEQYTREKAAAAKKAEDLALIEEASADGMPHYVPPAVYSTLPPEQLKEPKAQTPKEPNAQTPKEPKAQTPKEPNAQTPKEPNAQPPKKSAVSEALVDVSTKDRIAKCLRIIDMLLDGAIADGTISAQNAAALVDDYLAIIHRLYEECASGCRD